MKMFNFDEAEEEDEERNIYFDILIYYNDVSKRHDRSS